MDLTTFPFLLLPGEIRNTIYELLLKNDTRLIDGPYTGPKSRSSISSSIIRVSRQIYLEAHPLLYSLNRFNAHPSMLRTLPFLFDSCRRVESDACSSLITRFTIAVRLDTDPRWDGEKLAKAFDGLQELEVEAWQAAYGLEDVANLMPFAQVRGVRKAKVHGCGVSEEFSRWLEGVMQSPRGTEIEDCPRYK